jgi:negative modulator of initiation of replication
MKSVELSDETYEALQRLATAKNISPEKLLADLLGAGRPVSGDHLLFHLTSAASLKLTDPADRYLALLAWVARHHANDFADFISHQASARRYLRLSPAAVNAIQQQHETRQIDGTQFWAVMNIDPAAKSRFVRRLLEFIGCHDETVAEAIRVLSLTPVDSHRCLRLLSVA